MTPAAPQPFGAYVHIPFCEKRCDYCAFATWTDRSHLVDAYVDAVVTDIDRTLGHRPGGADLVATSVFFGGGTPSLLAPDSVGRILSAIPTRDDAEVTVECNPDTVDEEKLAGYRGHGVDRLSFGVQSMVPHVLASLGRTHDPDNVVRAVSAARAVGFANINLDLIYGGAGESVDDWRSTVEAAVALEPEHVSAYGLTVEPGTPLADDPARHPDDDDQADKYVIADEILSAAGLDWYEISNFARPGRECRHNLLYWRQQNYLGFGCAAHSHVDGRRWWNLRTPERYIAAVESGDSVEAAAEVLDDEQRRIEGLQLAIRMSEGVDDSAVDIGEGPSEVPSELVVIADRRARLTTAGRLLADEVTHRLH